MNLEDLVDDLVIIVKGKEFAIEEYRGNESKKALSSILEEDIEELKELIAKYS